MQQVGHGIKHAAPGRLQPRAALMSAGEQYAISADCRRDLGIVQGIADEKRRAEPDFL